MGYRYEIRLSGSGGQGLILMGIILAEAIGIYDGKVCGPDSELRSGGQRRIEQGGGDRQR